jgi:hypothetical protein
MLIFLIFLGILLTFLFGLPIIGFIDGFNAKYDNDSLPIDGAWLDRR